MRKYHWLAGVDLFIDKYFIDQLFRFGRGLAATDKFVVVVIGASAVALVPIFIGGVRVVRLVRRVTGDASWLTSILGLIR